MLHGVPKGDSVEIQEMTNAREMQLLRHDGNDDDDKNRPTKAANDNQTTWNPLSCCYHSEYVLVTEQPS
jgi:hypothetical protein